MNSITKFSRIVVYDNKNVVYSSIPVYGSMNVDDINNILSALSDAMPLTFSLRLE